MRKELQIATALAALLAAPALAQHTTPAAPAAGQQAAPLSTPQADSAPMSPSPSVQPSAPTAAAPSAGASGGLRFVDMQQAEEMLASTLIGTPVNNGANESLGDINDVLFDADGRLKAVVVGVGGFLGIAERDVAVPWDAFGVNRVEDQNPMLRLNVSREQLETAPEFVSVEERRMAEEAARAAQTPPATGIGAGGAVAPAPVPEATPPAPAP